MPSTEMLAAMGKFNEEMVKAGVMQAGEGLHPTSKGARVKYAGGQGTVTHGPFSLSGDLVCGFWLIETKSLDEAIDWMKRAPFDGRLRDRDPPGVRRGGFRRGADARAARAGRAPARAGGKR